MASRQDGDSEAESQRILRRLAQENEPSGTFVARMTNRARDHMTAADIDASDRIEQLGTRIGRWLAAGITVAVLVGFVLFLMQRG